MLRPQRGMRHRLRLASQRLADALFPPSCLACTARLAAPPAPTLLCVRCRGQFVRVRPETSCVTCLAAVHAARDGRPRCAACFADPPPFDRLIAPWSYQPPLSRAILALKFRHLRFLAGALAELAWAERPLEPGSYDAVAPVPLAPLRRLQRGFNQSELIAEVFGSRLGVPTADVLRTRGLGWVSQSRLGGRARRAPDRRRFVVRTPHGLAGARILLVDDVVTTGSTLRAAANALELRGARVTAFALAATPRKAP